MTWGAVGIGLAVTKMAYETRQAKKVEKKQKEKDEVNQRLAEIKARNERASQIQQRNIQAAQAASAGQASGAASSSTAGVQASLGTQAAANIGNINTSLAGASALTGLNRDIGKIQNKTQFIGGLLGYGSALAMKADADNAAAEKAAASAAASAKGIP
jgi:hypothetical protein